MFRTLKFVPGFIWALIPSLLSWIFFCIPYWLRGVLGSVKTFESVEVQEDLSIIWDINNKSPFFEKMKGWYGFTAGCNIVVVDVPKKDFCTLKKYLDHETGHVYQNYLFGIFFYPAYILITCYLWLFRKDKHAYLDNWFERQARAFAKQEVDIPKERWPEGSDRWPWW